MHKLNQLIKFASIVMVFVTMSYAYAESAPVYDADTMQQQFENVGNDNVQDYPPPPAPDQQGFVPAQAAVQPSAVQSQVTPTPSQNASLGNGAAQRLTRLEEQLNNLQTNSSSARVESLQSEVQTLRGQVEQLTHQVEQLQTQQKTLYSDLDKRLSQQSTNKPSESIPLLASNRPSADVVSTTPVTKARKTLVKPKVNTSVATATTSDVPKSIDVPKPVSEQPNVAEEQQIYQTAYNLIKAKKYNDAVGTLQKMLQKYPSGQFAANAHYWLGELFGLMSKHDQALNEFSTVVKTYPESPRVSDAQLKVGLIYASQMNWSEAKGAFKKVINHYPGTASARLASEQLKQLKQAGH